MPSPRPAETVAWVRAHCPETTVLVLTAHDRDDYLARMGVAGFVVKEQALWQPLLVRRITFAVDGTCVQGEHQSPEGDLLFHDADTRH